jgi:DNA-binding CsgD family transcriptional regulator
MNHWSLPLSDADAPQGLGAVIGAIGRADFAQAGLQGVNDTGLRAASWSVYQVWRERAPVLHLSSSLGVADATRSCFRAYHDGLYRIDRSFDTVAPGHAAVLRMHADEAPNTAHREAIYRRHQVLERLSVVRRGDDCSLFAVNLYHHEHQGRFSEGECAGFTTLAPLLLAAVQRHLALRPQAADPRAALRERCPALTERELDVCERLLRGWGYDGIAADMGLSVATVKTYRARAFERLGMHFKSELFAAFLPAH